MKQNKPNRIELENEIVRLKKLGEKYVVSPFLVDIEEFKRCIIELEQERISNG